MVTYQELIKEAPSLKDQVFVFVNRRIKNQKYERDGGAITWRTPESIDLPKLEPLLTKYGFKKVVSSDEVEFRGKSFDVVITYKSKTNRKTLESVVITNSSQY